MSNIKDVDKAVKIFRKYKCPFNLMHCVSAYPCNEENLNLKLIQKYKLKYKTEVGYSGHEKSVSPSLMAVCKGASSVERHITLDRTMGNWSSSFPRGNGMKNLVELVRKFEKVQGDGIKKFLPSEKEKLRENKYW